MLASLFSSPEVVTLLGWILATCLVGLVAGCDCCCCYDDACTAQYHCDECSSAYAWRVTLSGLANQNCLTCADLNDGEYILDRVTPTGCTFRYIVGTFCGASTSITLIPYWSGSTITLFVQLNFGTGSSCSFGLLVGGDGADCKVSGTATLSIDDAGQCDCSGATAYIEPICGP